MPLDPYGGHRAPAGTDYVAFNRGYRSTSGYRSPPSRTERFFTSFGRAANPIFAFQDFLDDPLKPNPLAPARTEEDLRRQQALLRSMVSTPEGWGGLAAGALPWGRRPGDVPDEVSAQLMRRGLEQNRTNQLLNQSESMDYPQGMSLFSHDRSGLPLEMYREPPRVENFMRPGDLAISAERARFDQRRIDEHFEENAALFDDPSTVANYQEYLENRHNWERGLSPTEVVEKNLDNWQKMLNVRWESGRREQVAHGGGGSEMRATTARHLQPGQELHDGSIVQQVRQQPDGTFSVQTEDAYGRSAGHIYNADDEVGVWGTRPASQSAARRPWQLPFQLEDALRLYLASRYKGRG